MLTLDTVLRGCVSCAGVCACGGRCSSVLCRRQRAVGLCPWSGAANWELASPGLTQFPAGERSKTAGSDVRAQLPGKQMQRLGCAVSPFAFILRSPEFAPAEQEGTSRAGNLAAPGLLPVLLLRVV